MLKKLLKGCLTIAMVSALAIPAMAVESSLNGRVRAWVENKSVKDGATITQMQSDGRFGGTVTGEAGDWTAEGFLQLGIDQDKGPKDLMDTVSLRNFTVALSNDDMKIKLGRQYPFGIAKGMGWCFGSVCDSYWAGESVENARADYLTVGLNNVGLTIIFGMDHLNDEGTKSDATGDKTPYDQTTVGAVFSKSFGSLGLAVEYTSQSFAVNDGDGAYGEVDGPFDGSSVANLAFAVDFAINDQMAVAFNYDSRTDSGDYLADDIVANSMEFWFDMGLDDTMGISVGYGMKTTDDGSDETTNETLTSLAFGKKLGAAKLFAEYFATTEKDDDDDTDKASSKIGLGMKVDF